MSEGSGVRFECPECGYETLLFPSSRKKRNSWLAGYDVPDVPCPRGHEEKETELGELFSENDPRLEKVESYHD